MLSDDEKEFYRGIYKYGPWMAKRLAGLSWCLRAFYQAQVSGNDLEMVITSVVPTISGYVAHQNKDWTKAVWEFNDTEDLEIILKRFVDEEKLYAEG